MNKESKDMENEQDWERHLKAVEIARSIVREETEMWREGLDLTDNEYTAATLAMEMQLFTMSLRAPMFEGGTETVKFFCELTGVDFAHIVEVMNNAIIYGHAAVIEEESNG